MAETQQATQQATQCASRATLLCAFRDWRGMVCGEPGEVKVVGTAPCVGECCAMLCEKHAKMFFTVCGYSFSARASDSG